MSNKQLKYNMTNDSVTVVWEGAPVTVRRGSPNFAGLRAACVAEDWGAVSRNLTPAKGLVDFCKGKFSLDANGNLCFAGELIPSQLSERIGKMAEAGDDPTPLLKFWEKLQKNPSMRSVQQLYPFLAHRGIPFTKDGNFLAYKGVRNDFKDKHSGTCDNKPGQVLEMERNKISDDPQQACHYGFHVGALDYARGFAERVVICEVDPTDVVCIPYDHSNQKMRVCRYKVIGLHNGEYLPDTTFEEEYDEYEYDSAGNSESDEVDNEVQQDNSTKDQKSNDLRDLNAMELLSRSTSELRAYAAKVLKIVGASKIPGGKTALVEAIMSAR